MPTTMPDAIGTLYSRRDEYNLLENEDARTYYYRKFVLTNEIYRTRQGLYKGTYSNLQWKFDIVIFRENLIGRFAYFRNIRNTRFTIDDGLQNETGRSVCPLLTLLQRVIA
jgi:hypothetical protein